MNSECEQCWDDCPHYMQCHEIDDRAERAKNKQIDAERFMALTGQLE